MHTFASDVEMKTNSKIVMLLAMFGWLHMFGSVNANEPKFKVVAKRADDRIEITSKDEATTFSVRSPSGIGSGTISRLTRKWPERMMLRLHLKGLEGLKISNGKMELVAEVAGPNNQRFLHVTKDANQRLESEPTKLAECAIRAVGKDGKPSTEIPLINGFFEVRLPQELFTTNPESITLNWVDFYR